MKISSTASKIGDRGIDVEIFSKLYERGDKTLQSRNVDPG